MPSDPPDQRPDPDPSEPEGPPRWTAPVIDARPLWGPLEVAWATLAPRALLSWSDAHRLPDGGRLDAFVRPDGGVLLLGADGRPWTCTGVAPGAVGPSLLVAPRQHDVFGRLLLAPVDDPVLGHVRRTTRRGGGSPS